ncbi:MAG: hypothetical protein LBR73_01815 [Oscillospiraceae bacterium]|jgi:hypothetical protein|nr:hypothetical protein [Oscillospiraceae bacterium]
MITEALRIMGFGMGGIFFVMGMIAAVLSLLNRQAARKNSADSAKD